MSFYRRTFTGLAAAVAAILPLIGSASAHHALEAFYDTATQLHATAIFNRVDWINPHVWLHVDVTEPDGRVDRDVMFETMSVSSLHAMGVGQGALKAGAAYAISYYPKRDGSAGGFVAALTLPDGREVGVPSGEPDVPCCITVPDEVGGP